MSHNGGLEDRQFPGVFLRLVAKGRRRSKQNDLEELKFSCTFPAQLCKSLVLNGAGEGNRTLVSVHLELLSQVTAIQLFGILFGKGRSSESFLRCQTCARVDDE